MRYQEIARELGIDPEQGVEQQLEQAGELVIGGRLITAEPQPTATEKAKAKSPTTGKEGE